MKQTIALAVLALASVAYAYAKDAPSYQSGTLTNMASAQCGTDENSGRTFVGEIIGTDGAHKKDRTMLCQEYTLESKGVVYRIRPRDEKHPVLLPVGEQAQFRLQRDKMLLRVEDLDGKEREYIVVSMTPRADSSTADATPSRLNHLQ